MLPQSGVGTYSPKKIKKPLWPKVSDSTEPRCQDEIESLETRLRQTAAAAVADQSSTPAGSFQRAV